MGARTVSRWWSRAALVCGLAACGGDTSVGDIAQGDADPSDVLETVDAEVDEADDAVEVEVEVDAAEVDSAETVDTAEVDSAETVDVAEVDSAETADVAEVDGADADTDAPDGVTLPCDPPLSADVERFALARQLRKVAPSGGSGEYRFAFVASPSGAILNGLTGEYVSGTTTRVTDRVRVTDATCAGELVVDVHVVDGMVVRPIRVELRPGEGFRPDVTGGSGAYDLALSAVGTSGANLTGATWAERRFVAGPDEGFDVVVVIDVETGETKDLPVTVDHEAIPVFSPPWLFLPPGASYPLASVSGSGELSVTVTGDGPGLLDDPADPPRRWAADSYGVSRVTAVDRFLGQPLVQHAVGLVGVGPVAQRSGQQLELWTAEAPGDLDGDGFAEAIVGGGELTLAMPLSGGVFLYRGGADGPNTTPVQVFSGEIRNEQFGAALALGDFDGDGRRDLAVGGPRYRVGTILPGRAVVYAGGEGASYSAAPVWTGTGLRNGDLFGHALTACDFDGDGYDDLAVGAYDSEDNVAPVTSNQGGVFLYRGGPGGLAPTSTQVLWGRVQGEAGWVGEVDLRFGRVLAAGDLDGDGACELVVGAPTAGADNGAVWVFTGDATGVGLVMPTPAAVWRGTRAGRLGWALAVGDFDRDTVADLVIGQPRWSTSATVSDNHGALRWVAGGPWVQGGASEELPFDHSVFNPGTTGNDTNDELGFRLAVGDVDNDGWVDLVVAGIADEVTCTGCVTNSGAVHVLVGREDGWPAFPAAHSVAAAVSTDRQGAAIAVVGVSDSSGEVAVLSVLGRDDSHGADFGRAMVLWPKRPGPSFNAAQTTLEMPGLAYGWRAAQAVEVLGDLDGDGFDEVALGVPQAAGPPPTGIPVVFSGMFTVHRGNASGVEVTPWQVGSGFRRHSTGDRWGFDLARLDDFDGDGRVDLAVVGRTEDAATSYGTGTFSTAACNAARTDVGAVAIFGTSAAGVDAQPMLMHFGPQVSQVIEVVVGADVDGDGLTDLIAGSRAWDRPTTGTGDNGGGFEVVRGRARAHATSTEIVCEPERRHFGMAAADGFAASLVALGDLDGDGCDEVAVGIPGADFFGSAGGAVEIFFGAGAVCASVEPRRVVFAAPVANTGLGNAIHAADVNGDGLVELVVGGSTHRVNNVAVGGAWVLPGTVLAGLVAQAAPRADGVAPTAIRLFGAGGLVESGLVGQLANELYGTGVALVPYRAGRDRFVAVASQASAVAGVNVGGLVFVHKLVGGTMAIEPRPTVVVGGEAHGGLPTAKMTTLVAGGGRHLLIGASESSAVAPFSGALWVVPLDGLAALEASMEGP